MKNFKTIETELQKLKKNGGKPKTNVGDHPKNPIEPGSAPEPWMSFGQSGMNGDGYAFGVDWKSPQPMSEGKASDEAHKRGLESAGWGRWRDPKSGKVVAKTVDGGSKQERLEPMSLDDDSVGDAPVSGEEPKSTVTDSPARRPGEKDPKGGKKGGKTYIEIMEAVGNPAAAAGGAKDRANAMGLKSDGHGGYVDQNGNRVAETVNGEIGFFDPQGGATDDSNSPSPLLPQAQIDPYSGLFKVPGAKLDPDQQMEEPIPAKAPVGYDQMLDKIRQNRMSSIPDLDVLQQNPT